MAGRPNHRGWIVLESVRSLDGQWCVDVFERQEGGFGFEHLRAEPEDGGRWTAVGGFGARGFASASEALDHAIEEIGWLDGERGDALAARERLNSA